MKTKGKILFILVLTTILGCSNRSNEVIITGTIVGKIPEKIVYTYPTNETNFWNFTRITIPDSLGNFVIRIPIEKPTFVNLYTENNPVIILEPKGKYHIDIDIKEQNYNISTKHENIQKFYNNLSRINPRTCHFQYGEDISKMDEIVSGLEDKLKLEMQELEEISNKGDISEELFQLVLLDRRIYYLTAQGVLASINNVNHIREFNSTSEEINKIWGEAVLSIPLESNILLRTNYAYDFLEMFLWYKAYTTFELEDFRKLRKEYREKDQIHTHTLELAKQLFENENVLEFYTAGYIHFNSFRDSKDLITTYEMFTNEYPESKYIEFLIPRFETID